MGINSDLWLLKGQVFLDFLYNPFVFFCPQINSHGLYNSPKTVSSISFIVSLVILTYTFRLASLIMSGFQPVHYVPASRQAQIGYDSGAYPRRPTSKRRRY